MLETRGAGWLAQIGKKGGAALSREQQAAAGRLGNRARWGGTHPLPGLKAARLRAGLSQEALAASAGVSGFTVSVVERGSRGSAGTVAKLAAALGVEEAALLSALGPTSRRDDPSQGPGSVAR